jgi:hypothetical protein
VDDERAGADVFGLVEIGVDLFGHGEEEPPTSLGKQPV